MLKEMGLVITGIFAITLTSCSQKEIKPEKDISLLTKAVKINAEKQTEIDAKVKKINASQIENKLEINNLKKDVAKLKKENEKLISIIKLNNSENKKISKAINLTINSQEELIKKVHKLEKNHDLNYLIEQGKIYAVPTVWLNVREKPSHKSKKIGLLKPGERKRIYGKSLDATGKIWYKIDKGYISSSYSILNVENFE